MMKALVSNIIENHAILAHEVTQSRSAGYPPAPNNDGTYAITKKGVHCVLSVSHTWLQTSTNELQETRVSWPNEPWSLWFHGENDSDKSRMPILELSPETLTPERPSPTTWETTTKEVVFCNQKQTQNIKRRIRRRSEQ